MARPMRAAVWGHRRESNPGQSVYTRVLDLDWIQPTGDSASFGGDVLIRVAKFSRQSRATTMRSSPARNRR